MAKRPFSVRLAVSGLASAATDTDGYQLQTGETFVAESATYMVAGATLAGVPVTDASKPFVLVDLRDNASGQSMFSDPVPLETIAGDAKNPFVFPVPPRFVSKPFMQVENISSDTTYSRVYLVLHGYLETKD